MHPLRDNPFFVLELPPTATPMEIERQGKKLLSMLELELAKSLTFQTPYGAQTRTAERVREAVQLLLDPGRRLPFEVWATASFAPRSTATSTAPPEGPEALPLAHGATPADSTTTTTTTTTTRVEASHLVWWKP